jgi:octaprenyl-diphosphate synthase
LTAGEIADGDLEHALSLMRRYKAIEATFERARHYGAIATDALAIFPDSKEKAALTEVVQFCVSRAY